MSSIHELFSQAEELMPRTTFLHWQPIEELAECIALLPSHAEMSQITPKNYIEMCTESMGALEQLLPEHLFKENYKPCLRLSH